MDVIYTASIEFLNLCRNGSFDDIIKYYDNNQVSNHTLNKGFVLLCIKNKIDAVKWIYNLNHDVVLFGNCSGFIYACSLGHLALVEWFLSLGNIDIRVNSDMGFISACQNNRIKVVEWLASLSEHYNYQHDGTTVINYSIDDIDFKINWSRIAKLVDDNDTPRLIDLFGLYNCKVEHTNNTDEYICAVCFDTNVETSTPFVYLDCKHAFCIKCLVAHVRTYHLCKCSICNRFIELEKSKLLITP